MVAENLKMLQEAWQRAKRATYGREATTYIQHNQHQYQQIQSISIHINLHHSNHIT